jgi:acyl carrier protein
MRQSQICIVSFLLEGLKMSAIATNVQDRLLALVRAILEQSSIVAEVVPNTRLVDIGLTSMDMVNLMLRVEAEFDLSLPPSEITPDNFRSVQMIGRLIAKVQVVQGTL